ncbi:PH domain-containing protein [Burkholderia sp. AU19243]|nr:PH domain-containing protein [Burkholderia vietnamiensis]MBR8367362.1 PH domain-containing protein [Burkholderia sp. AU19243]
MARYVEKNLMPEEQIVYQGQLSLWHLAPKIVAGLLLLPLFGIGLLLWLDVFIQYKSTELAITNKRIVAKFGFIRRSTVEIGIRKIESIQIHQGILGRLFGFGSIVMAGAGNPQAPIPGISDPMEFRKRFLQQQEATT